MRAGLLLLAASVSLAACTWRTADLEAGCYRAGDGTPILKVAGENAELLVPGDVRRVRLTSRRARGHPVVDVEPGFFLRTPQDPPGSFPVTARGHPGRGWQAENNRQPGATRFQLEPATRAILVPVLASGEEPVRRGAPC
jgi:hypothetical protein